MGALLTEAVRRNCAVAPCCVKLVGNSGSDGQQQLGAVLYCYSAGWYLA